MKRGRPAWTTKCPPDTLRLARERLAAGESAQQVFEALHLRRYVSAGQFRVTAARWRRDRRARLEAGAAGGSAASDASPWPSLSPPSAADGGRPDPQSLFDLLLAEMQTSVARGDVKLYELASAIKSLLALRGLETREAAERRAAELHAVKLAELKAKQQTALDEASTAVRLTDEQLAEIRARVLGI